MKKISLFILVILSSLFIGSGCVNAQIYFYPAGAGDNTEAFSSTGYMPITRGYIYNCSGTSTCTSNVSSYGNGILRSTSTITLATYGMYISFMVDGGFLNNYMYSISWTMCSNNSFAYSSYTGYTGNGYTLSDVTAVSSSWSTYKTLNGISALGSENEDITLSYCNTYYQIFTAKKTGAFYGVRLLATSSASYRIVVGYNVESLGSTDGLTSSDIQSIIDNSGLATASDIDDIEASIDVVSEELEEVNSSINSLSDSVDSYNETLDTGINSESDDVESSSCGIICKLKAVVQGIAELPSKLVNLLIDALKSLFVPTDEQLYELIESSQDLAENFGFVGEAVSFFISIFTSLLGLINGNGCIDLPEFSIGATSLFDSFTFWEAQNVCLADNVVLADNIDTIRVVTSIGLVGLFLGFASSQFFSILSKETKDTDNSESEDKE